MQWKVQVLQTVIRLAKQWRIQLCADRAAASPIDRNLGWFIVSKNKLSVFKIPK